MDSRISIEDIAQRAVELGHKTLSTVEHGFFGDQFGYYDISKKYNLKFIFGVEFYYVHDRFSKDKTNAHILILAKNMDGKKQLTKLVSESNLNGFHYKPRIDKQLLFSLNPNDVVVTTACIGGIYGKYEDESFILECCNHFGKNFYLGLHANTHYKQVEYNKKLLRLHNTYNIPLIFEADTHYIQEEDAKWRDLLLKGRGMFYEDEDGFVMDYPTIDTIFQRFKEQGVFTKEQVQQALKNTLIVDDFDEIIMNKDIKMPSIYPNLTHEQKVQKLKEIINREWVYDRQHISQSDFKKYLDAIRFEMDIIEKTHTEDYFLLNYDIIKKAKEKGGILTRTGRGSAPSFYLNKLLGFTEID
jgi:DNA polymerase III alpha subunit